MPDDNDNQINENEMAQNLYQEQLKARQSIAKEKAKQAAKQAGKEVAKKAVKKVAKAGIKKIFLALLPYIWPILLIIIGSIIIIFLIIGFAAMIKNDPCMFGGLFSELVGEVCEVFEGA